MYTSSPSRTHSLTDCPAPGLSRANFRLSMKQQAGGSGGGEASSNGRRRITLGPGLFAPDIQGGGPDKSANKVRFPSGYSPLSICTQAISPLSSSSPFRTGVSLSQSILDFDVVC